MKYIKIFEKFRMERDLKKYRIFDYTINDDYSIDVNGNVSIQGLSLKEIPFKFNRVTGHFICFNNKLATLAGSPYYVGGMFNCNNNNLVNLIGAPDEVEDDFVCTNNKLISLEGCPKEIGGSLNCQYNKLTKLDTISNIKKDIYCGGNKIDTNENGFDGWCGGEINNT